MAATKTVAQRPRLRKSRTPLILAAKPHLAIAPRHGVITLFGYGISVRVDRGHLILEDGIGRDRRYARIPRVGHELKRLVVIGNDGMVSLAALRWLTHQNAAFVMIERNGTVLTTASPVRSSDARMRRTQALALQSGTALGIARQLIDQKLAGQERIARKQLRNSNAADVIASFRANLEHVRTLPDLRAQEAQAGATYWTAWRDLKIVYPKKHLARIPDHWLRFEGRTSLISKTSARLAINPPNAMLNYLYALLESEARFAAIAVGLDLGLGLLHADSGNRASMVLDLMEPVRPQVDALVLDWINREPLSRDWFFEEQNGNCRLMAPFAARLAETLPVWRRAIAPIAESVARSLWSAAPEASRPRRPGTPLTGTNQRLARSRSSIVSASKTTAKPRSLCRICGVPVAPQRKYCAACGVTYSTQNIVKAGEAGRKRSHSPEAQANRAKAARRNAIAQWHWDPSTLPAWLTQDTYVNRIHPLLAKVPVTAIGSAIGVARSSAAEIRRGRRIPHPRHWVKLAELVGVTSG